MKHPTCIAGSIIDSLESRRLLSTTYATRVPNTPTTGSNEPHVYTPAYTTEDGPLSPGGPVLGDFNTRFDAGDGAFMATQGLSRSGTFILPKVSADGSVSLVGSSEADNITVERVTGIQELPRTAYGAPGDGEFDFVMLLNDSGEYVRLDGTADARGILDQQRLQKARLSSAPDVVASWKDDTSAQGKINYRTSSEAYAQELRDNSVYTNLADRYANGTFIHYTLAGAYDFYVEVNPNAASQPKLSIDGRAGADNISVSSNVPMRTNLSGGSGADKLTSGKRIANLFGGGGNDLLINRSTKGGTLDGGKGSDRYVNSAASGDVRIVGRNDGDQVLAGNRLMSITVPAVFGTSAIAKDRHLLVDGANGPIDLLS